MLSLMRRNAGSWIIKIVLFVIVIVFMFWGVGSYSEMRRNRVATVGGYTITLRDFDSTYRSMLQQLQANLGGQLNDEILQSMQLEKQALTQLINREVVLQAASKLKLVVSDEELRSAIYSAPEFQNENGEFDAQRYRAILSNMQINDEAYEEMKRDDLLIDKLMELVLSDVKVSDAETAEWYQHFNRRMAAKYVAIDPTVYPVAVSEEEMQAYYDAHKDLYMTQPMRKIAYAKFSPEEFISQIEMSEAQLRDLYDSNIDLYSTPDLLDISQIVVRIEQPGNADSEARAQAKIEEAAAKLKDGAPFAEVVAQYSELMFQANEGRGENLPKSDFVAFFGEDAVTIAEGEITPPLKTDFAWYLFKFDAVKPAEVKSFEDVKDELRESVVLNEARNMAYDAAEDISAAVFGGEDLEAAAGAKGVEVVTTDYFDRGMLVNSLTLLQRSAFTDYVFSFEVGDVTEPQEFEGDYYVVVIQDEKASELIPLDDVKVVVEHAVYTEKQMARAVADAEKIIAAVKSGQSIEEAAEPYEAEVKNTGFITRSEPVVDLAVLGTLLNEAVFSLNAANPVLDEPLPGPVVLVYDAFAAADENEYDEAAALNLKLELLQAKRNMVFEKYLVGLKQKTKIWVADNFTQFYDM